MAETVSAGRGKRRDSKGELPEQDSETPLRTLPNLATDNDAQRWMSQVIVMEREKESFEAAQRASKAAMKSKYDKLYTDAADALKSRGITKRILRETYEVSRRKDEENRAEFQAKLWLLRAAGIGVGQQLGFFEDGFAGEDEALRRARQAGYDAFTDKKPDSANPFHPSSVPGQKWIEGYNAAGADSLMGSKAH